jgi:hypothetical protein
MHVSMIHCIRLEFGQPFPFDMEKIYSEQGRNEPNEKYYKQSPSLGALPKSATNQKESVATTVPHQN